MRNRVEGDESLQGGYRLPESNNTKGVGAMVSWRMAEEWPDASYACVNLRETYAPDEIRHAVCVRGDIGETLRQLKTL